MNGAPLTDFEGTQVDTGQYEKLKNHIDLAVRFLSVGGLEGGFRPLSRPPVTAEIRGLLAAYGEGKDGKPGREAGAAVDRQVIKTLNKMLNLTNFLCEYEVPPKQPALIQGRLHPNRRPFFKCKHSPPHYFDLEGNLINRPD